MDPDEYVSMVCSSLIEVASALTSLSHNQESKVAMVSPEFLLAVAENLRVVKAVEVHPKGNHVRQQLWERKPLMLYASIARVLSAVLYGHLLQRSF